MKVDRRLFLLQAASVGLINNWRNGVPKDQWIGETRRFTIEGQRRTILLAKDASLIAIRPADEGGQWASIATPGVNNYSDMWLQKQVYTE